MLCKNKVVNLDFKSKKNNAKHNNLFGLKKFYDQKQKAHIMLNEQCKVMHDSV